MNVMVIERYMRRSVAISCHTCVGVLSPMGCLGRSSSLDARTDAGGENSLSRVVFNVSYVISSSCVSSHGEIVWNTASGTASNA